MSDSKDLTKMNETMPERSREVPSVTPLVDIYENDDEILLYVDMPGVNKDKVSVNIDNGRLSLSGRREVKTSGAEGWIEFGDVEYVRNFSVPQSIDTGKVIAELKDGVLRLHLPKAEAAKPRQIEIKAA
jgi:HSP20 family protein